MAAASGRSSPAACPLPFPWPFVCPLVFISTNPSCDFADSLIKPSLSVQIPPIRPYLRNRFLGRRRSSKSAESFSEGDDDPLFLELDDLRLRERVEPRRPLPAVRLEVARPLQDPQLQHLPPEVPLVEALPQDD